MCFDTLFTKENNISYLYILFSFIKNLIVTAVQIVCTIIIFYFVFLKGGHGLTVVVWYKSSQKRDTSCNLLFGKESQDSNLSKTTIVQFFDQSFGLLFLSLVLRESKRIKKVEWYRVRDKIRIGEVWIFSRNSSSHVVCSSSL